MRRRQGTTTHPQSSIPPPPSFYNHVIFNHPHLGTEDALLHSRFLAHLFHALTGRWMKPDGGLLHPTLVIEQCKRWRCLEWADRHGLVLIQRGKFIPPLLLLLLPPPKIMRMPRGELPAGRPRAAAAAARPTTV
jgi:hypothetical protein